MTVVAIKIWVIANVGEPVQQGLPLVRVNLFKRRAGGVKAFAFHTVRPNNLMRIKHQVDIRHLATCVHDAHGAVVDQIARRTSDGLGGIICFVPGTRIRTPTGPILVEELAEGDRICTKDSGPQAVRWIGSRRMTGGRLIVMPQLRPIRLRAHALADGEPDGDLIVSPDHRVLLNGPVAQALFDTPEVLVAAVRAVVSLWL